MSKPIKEPISINYVPDYVFIRVCLAGATIGLFLVALIYFAWRWVSYVMAVGDVVEVLVRKVGL